MINGEGRSVVSTSSGFSLLETLVALVILSLALGALYQAAAGATRNAFEPPVST